MTGLVVEMRQVEILMLYGDSDGYYEIGSSLMPVLGRPSLSLQMMMKMMKNDVRGRLVAQSRKSSRQSWRL